MPATGLICGNMRDGQEVKSLGSCPRDRWFKSSSPQLVGLTTITCGDARKGVNLYTTPPFMVNSSNIEQTFNFTYNRKSTR